MKRKPLLSTNNFKTMKGEKLGYITYILEYFLSSRVEFLTQVKDEIAKALKKNKDKAIVTIRLNGTSDLPFEKFKIFEGKNIFEVYPDVQFYDYTKNYIRFEKELPKNYHLTFSRSEINHDKAIEILNKGYNVAMVFDKLPDTFNGFRVINGDENDLRFLDDKNVIVGLKYKKMTGKGADNSLAFTSGFAIKTLDTEKVIKKIDKVYKKANVKNQVLTK